MVADLRSWTSSWLKTQVPKKNRLCQLPVAQPEPIQPCLRLPLCQISQPSCQVCQDIPIQPWDQIPVILLLHPPWPWD